MLSRWKNLVYWRLGLALALSVLLHLLVVKGLDIRFPDLWADQESSTIKVVLVSPPKALAPSHAPPIFRVAAKPAKPVAKKTPAPLPPPPQTEASANPAPVEAVPAQPSADIPALQPAPQTDDQQQITADEPVTQDEAVTVAKSPVSVETDFDGEYIETHISYQFKSDGSYLLKSVAEAKGLAAFALGKLTQVSEGVVTERGLKPSSFLYQYGNNKDKSRRATFDWTAGTLTMEAGKKIHAEDIAEGTQDFLSFMYQFMFVPPLEQMQLAVTDGKKLGHHVYSFEGEETLKTRMGMLRTIHIAKTNADNDRKVDLWLAMDYRYIPVKIRFTEKDGSVIEQTATRITSDIANVDPAR
jgi:hypothetical protein